MAMHRDTKQDYEHFLKNMNITEKDIPSEYKLAHVMMAGETEQVQEILDKMETEDFWDLGVQTIFNTVKEEAEQGNVFGGQEQFLNIHSKHLDRFTSKNFHLNPDNKNYTDLTNFYLLDEAPDDIEMRACMQVVKDKRMLRDTIHKLYEAVDMCTHEDNGTEKAYQFLGDMVFSHETEKAKEEDVSKFQFAEGMTKLLYEYNDPEKRNQKTINMPWKKFQRIVGGFGLEELVIVSAKSGQGKSAFSLNVGIEVGVTQQIPTLYINSELSNEQMIERYLSYACYLDSRKIREGKYYDERDEMKVNDKVYKAVSAAADRYYKSNLLFKRIPDLQLSNIEKAIRTDCMERQTKLVIVDYLGRMDITKFNGVRDLQEWQIMRLAANRLKTLAQKYHVCIIMVCQLTDEGTLQGSKAMKNECDMWLSINRLKNSKDTYADKHLVDIEPYNTFINIEKARNVNDNSCILVRYEGSMMRFCDTAEKIKEMVEKNGVYKDGFKDYTNKMLTDREANNLQTIINAEKDEWWNK
jgi:replicative DNA helicase